jgi:hypothetical protein
MLNEHRPLTVPLTCLHCLTKFNIPATGAALVNDVVLQAIGESTALVDRRVWATCRHCGTWMATEPLTANQAFTMVMSGVHDSGPLLGSMRRALESENVVKRITERTA